MSEPTSAQDDEGDTRARVVAAAEALIAEAGPDAATTRAVATRAGVQPPAIYRLFGDKRGLLDAVLEGALASYVANKRARKPLADPVDDLRAGWDLHVAFWRGHPGLFAIVCGDLRPRSHTAPAKEMLRQQVQRIARAGRLVVSEERAIALIQSAATGAVLTLLRTPADARDDDLSTSAREALIAAITSDGRRRSDLGPRAAATALRASLDATTVLSAGERHLLEELLQRIADAAP